MAGFASFIGGTGTAAGEYGRDIRHILEQRRGAFVDFLNQAAQNESDPGHRAALHGYISDLLLGKDLSKVVPQAIKTFQDRHQSNQVISQTFGGPPQPKQPQPGPARPGGVPGTFSPLPNFSAAQPATSPVSPQAQTGGQTLGPLSPVAGLPSNPAVQQESPTPGPFASMLSQPIPQAAPEAAPQAVPSTSVAQSPYGEFDPRAERARIIEEGNRAWMAATPAARAHVEAMVKEKLDALAPFEKQALLGHNLRALMAERPDMSDLEKNYYAAQAQGFQPFGLGGGMASAMFTPTHMGNLTADQVLRQWPQEAVAAGIQPGGQPVDVWANKITGKPVMIGTRAVGNAVLQGFDTTTGAPIMVEASRFGTPGAIQPIGTAQAAPPAANRIIQGVGPSGNIEATSEARNFVHAPNMNTGLVPASTLPTLSSSTLTVPGHAPQTTNTVRSRGLPPRAGSATTSGLQGPEPRIVPLTPMPPSGQATSGEDKVVVSNYKSWAAGGPSPTGKQLAAVLEYAQRTNQPIPVQLSATGQKDMSSISDVLNQIKRIKSTMESMKLQNDNTLDKYTDFLRAQRLGQSTPLGSLWTDLSFEGFRSGGAALKGISARGQQILTKAMEHVPRPAGQFNPFSHEPIHAPDSPARMYQKLGEMEKVLSDSLNEVLKDERKGGTLPNVGAGIPEVTDKAEYDKLPSGAQYMQNGVTYTKR